MAPRANGGSSRKLGPQKYTADSVVVVSDAVTRERLLAVVVEPQGEWAEENTSRSARRHRQPQDAAPSL